MRTRTIITWLAVLGWLLAFSVHNAASADADKGTKKSTTATEADAKGPYLGVALGPVHPALASHLADVIGKGRGVLVTNVVAGSPAEKAGVKEHDILVSYDKQDLYSPEQLAKLVQNDKVDRDVAIAFVHQGTLTKAMIHLEEAPAKDVTRNHTSFRLPLEDLMPFERFGWSQKGPRPNVMFKDDKSASSWKSLQSLSLKKVDGDRFEASIEYRDQDGKTVTREFTGTRTEIRKTIEQDEKLPDDARNHLLRSIDQQSPFGFFLQPQTGSWNRDSEDRGAAEF
jgi:membrane-associated protease RseP (regulator of RpoE activity)